MVFRRRRPRGSRCFRLVRPVALPLLALVGPEVPEMPEAPDVLEVPEVPEARQAPTLPSPSPAGSREGPACPRARIRVCRHEASRHWRSDWPTRSRQGSPVDGMTRHGRDAGRETPHTPARTVDGAVRVRALRQPTAAGHRCRAGGFVGKRRRPEGRTGERPTIGRGQAPETGRCPPGALAPPRALPDRPATPRGWAVGVRTVSGRSLCRGCRRPSDAPEAVTAVRRTIRRTHTWVG